VKKPEENIPKRNNEQFAKIGNYYVKSHNLNGSNMRSLTEDVDRIGSVDSEEKEGDSFNNKNRIPSKKYLLISFLFYIYFTFIIN